jgi:hypothetical protein
MSGLKTISEQYELLDENAKSRYDEKKKVISGLDPYSLHESLYKMGRDSLPFTPRH